MKDERNEEIARVARQRLNELESPYLRAQEYKKSPQFVEDQLKCLAKIRKVVKMTKDPTEALFTMGRIWEVLSDTFAFEETEREWESNKTTLERMFPKEK